MKTTLAALAFLSVASAASAFGQPNAFPTLTFPDPAPIVSQACTSPTAIVSADCPEEG